MNKQVNILIKEQYVEGLLQDLVKKDAILILDEESETVGYEIPEWQKEETRRRMEAFHKNRADVYSWSDVKKMLENDEEM